MAKKNKRPAKRLFQKEPPPTPLASLVHSNFPVSERIYELAVRLSEIHGKVVIRKEASGIHLYMASPKALEEDGVEKELRSRHLAVNAEKALKIGKYAGQIGQRKAPAQCMKYKTCYFLDELLSFPPLDQRGFPEFTRQAEVVKADVDRYLITDEFGNRIPDHPGKVIPIRSMSHEHPVCEFIGWRGYDPILLASQFRVGWCEEEAPEGKEFNRWYRKHDAGWKSTPQGRLIFYCDIGGVQQGWQGRYLEVWDSGGKRAYHPYRKRWEYYASLGGEFNNPYLGEKWPPVKYLTAPGSMRNRLLCGFDHAVAAASCRTGEKPSCVLTEGPFDAARFPDHGIALLGKYLSDTQARFVAAWFRHVVLAFDIDESGRELDVNARRKLEPLGARVVSLDLSGVEKDVGELSYAEAGERLASALASIT